MMNIRIICIGKFKEKYWEAASAEYIKRLSSYCNVSVTELREERLPANASHADEEMVMKKEGRSVLDKIGKGSSASSEYVIALDIGGRELGSEEIAAKIREISFTNSTVDFIIGGSLGLSDEVRSRADMRLSFGKITLPHQLARVVLLEQIYRVFKINAGEKYHK